MTGESSAGWYAIVDPRPDPPGFDLRRSGSAKTVHEERSDLELALNELLLDARALWVDALPDASELPPRWSPDEIPGSQTYQGLLDVLRAKRARWVDCVALLRWVRRPVGEDGFPNTVTGRWWREPKPSFVEVDRRIDQRTDGRYGDLLARLDDAEHAVVTSERAENELLVDGVPLPPDLEYAQTSGPDHWGLLTTDPLLWSPALIDAVGGRSQIERWGARPIDVRIRRSNGEPQSDWALLVPDRDAPLPSLGLRHAPGTAQEWWCRADIKDRLEGILGPEWFDPVAA